MLNAFWLLFQVCAVAVLLLIVGFWVAEWFDG